MNTAIILVIFRLISASIFASGAVYLASIDKDGWGWCIVAAIILGSITFSNGEVKE